MAAAVAPAARRADSTRTEGADVSQCAQGGVERQKVAGAAAYAEGRFADAAGAFAAAHAAAREARLPARQRASLASNAAAASLRAGDAGRAAEMARAAAQDDGSWAKPHVRLAEALGTTGAAARDEAGGVVYEPEAAYKVLREGGAKAVRARLAAAEASKAAFDEAAEALARAVELSPNASGGEADAAVSRLRVARTAAAAAGVLESLWKEFEKGAATADEKDADKRVMELTAAAEERERPPEATASLARGELLLGRRDAAGAEAAFRQALRADGDTYQAAHGLGLALQAQGRLAEACAAFRRAMAANHEYMLPYVSLGSALEARGEEAEAEAVLRRAHRVAPEFVSTNSALALLLIRTGKLGEVVKMLRLALAGGPEGKFTKPFEDPTCSLILGYVLQMQGYTAEPQSHFLRCVSDASGEAMFQYLNARACCESDHEMARASLEGLKRVAVKYPKRWRDSLLMLNWRFDAPQWRMVGSKVGLHALLAANADSDGGVACWPESYALPREAAAARMAAAADPSARWILKDAASSGGAGLRLLGSVAVASGGDLMPKGAHEALLQRYVGNPLLIAGRKFSVRLYVVFLGWPARAWICTEGQTLFCAKEYAPAEGAAGDVEASDELEALNAEPTRHLSNQQLNVRASEEEHAAFEALVPVGDPPAALGEDAAAEDVDEGAALEDSLPEDTSEAMREAVMEAIARSKRPGFSRTLEPLRAACAAVGRDYDALWEEMRGACLCASRAALRALPNKVGSLSYKMHARLWVPKILGVDLMLDEGFVPWLLEVNRYPALHARGAADAPLKRALARDAWALAVRGGGLGDGAAGRGEALGCLAPLMAPDGSDALRAAVNDGAAPAPTSMADDAADDLD